VTTNSSNAGCVGMEGVQSEPGHNVRYKGDSHHPFRAATSKTTPMRRQRRTQNAGIQGPKRLKKNSKSKKGV